MKARALVEKHLRMAGIEINGPHPWDFRVNNPRIFDRIIRQGSLGLGEAYMDGWWDTKKLDEFFVRILSASLEEKVRGDWRMLPYFLRQYLFGMLSKSRAFLIGKTHYDLGNDLYRVMLDQHLIYTCAYWKNARNLDEAQKAKLDLVCRKLNLQPGQKVLDIGCGWGGFAKFAAENYGAHVVGITVSEEQKILGDQLCRGLPVEIRLQDYRQLNEKFDHIVSLGMFEHVGSWKYRTYLQVAHRCLKDAGLFLLHTIGGNYSVRTTDPWIHKYIFPVGMIPSVAQIGRATEKLFVVEDWHNFGPDYDKTLMAWDENFQKDWEKIQENYDERFYRMWRYYLLCCAGSFRARKNQLWQIILSKNGVPGGYQSVR